MSVQLSSRDNSFFEQCEKYYKHNSEELTVDYFFVISLNDQRRYRKYINSKYYVIGTVRNNKFYKIKKKFRKKKKNFIYISAKSRKST